MFERFTDSGRHVVVLAQEEARELRHGAIGTEHLLLGLIREEKGIAAHALASLQLTLDETRLAVARIAGAGDVDAPGAMTFTPPAKQTLELSLREAVSLGHNYIGTEHVLLALARRPDRVPAQIFEERALDERRIRGVVAKLMASPPGRLERVRRAAWEYRIVQLAEGPGLTVELLSELGAEGWELVTVVGGAEDGRAVFKRRA
jgi:ATP-dependent Clp protease ATP-binding subunit ClpC